jgi:hypothetical protein
MNKIGCSQNKPIIFDTNVTKIIWLTWLKMIVWNDYDGCPTWLEWLFDY